MEGILGSKCLLGEQTFKTDASGLLSQNRFNYEIEDPIQSIERVPNNISYDEFFKLFLLKNVPCLIESKPDLENNPKNWKISKEWVVQNESEKSPEGSPNWTFIDEKFCNSVVPVADCSQPNYNSQAKTHVWLPQYIKYCKSLVKENHDYTKMPCLYLKDWHFSRVFPDYDAYTTPIFFQSDWLNAFCKSRTDEEDDYCFIYMGPKGTWTPFHADVFGSYSWSTNICGRKRWLLFPPGAEKSFKDLRGKLAYSITLPELDNEEQFPEAKKYFEKWGRGIEVIQEPGESIFVPSGWHHQVWNTADTISVNHNWFNGSNIDIIWSNLIKAYNEVKEEIQDCQTDQEFEATCQLVLKAHHGMNYAEFLFLLEFVVARSNEMIINAPDEEIQWHIAFDLHRVISVIHAMKEERSLNQSLMELLEKIENHIKSIQNKYNIAL